MTTPGQPTPERAQPRPATPPLFEHAPGHPYWSQAGPGGAVARGCKVEGCDWFETTPPRAQA